MKTNAPDFPEKVYIPRDPEYPQSPNIWWERESSESNIEYFRTDVLFKRAKEWFLVSGIDSFCEDFLNYISYER